MTGMMIVLIKTLTKYLTYSLKFVFVRAVGQIFCSTVLFVMVAAQCTDNLRFQPYCDVITNFLLGADHNQWKKFLDLRGHYVRPYFKWPKQRESHDPAVLNIFMYMYSSYSVSVF